MRGRAIETSRSRNSYIRAPRSVIRAPIGIREQIIFPEVDYDDVETVRGLDVTITTSADTDEEAFALLRELGLPFRAQAQP